MSDNQRALVLHLSTGGAPVVFALSVKAAKSLRPRLSVLMASGQVDTLELDDMNTVAVNFGHVATAHLDELSSTAIYGSGSTRRSGFTG